MVIALAAAARTAHEAATTARPYLWLRYRDCDIRAKVSFTA